MPMGAYSKADEKRSSLSRSASSARLRSIAMATWLENKHEDIFFSFTQTFRFGVGLNGHDSGGLALRY